MGFTTNLILFYALFFVIGVVVPAFSTSAMTLLQETVEPERQGRVFGFVGIVMSVAMPLGMAVLGPLADVVSVELLLIVTGAATVVIALFAVTVRACCNSASNSCESKSSTAATGIPAALNFPTAVRRVSTNDCPLQNSTRSPPFWQ